MRRLSVAVPRGFYAVCVSGTFGDSLDIGNEGLPKIIINNTAINLFLKTAISILVVSNRNSFRAVTQQSYSPGVSAIDY